MFWSNVPLLNPLPRRLLSVPLVEPSPKCGFCDYYFCFAAGQLLPGRGLARHDLWWPCKICPGTTDHRSHQSPGHSNITALFNKKRWWWWWSLYFLNILSPVSVEERGGGMEGGGRKGGREGGIQYYPPAHHWLSAGCWLTNNRNIAEVLALTHLASASEASEI